MTKMLRNGLSIAALSLALPVASYAITPQQCATLGGVYNPATQQCVISTPQAPEIGASASVGGVALLLCGVMMLRGRKRIPVTSIAA